MDTMDGGSQRQYFYAPVQPVVTPKQKPIKSSTGIKFCCTLLKPHSKDYNQNPYINNETLETLKEILPQLEVYSTMSEITEAIELVDNFGRPVYKHWKGVLPGGATLEGGLGFLTQLGYDLDDRSTIKSWDDMLSRATTAGVEDLLTELVSNPVRAATATVMSPLGPIGTGVGYLAGGIGTTWFMDTIVWQPINYSNRFYRP